MYFKKLLLSTIVGLSMYSLPALAVDPDLGSTSATSSSSSTSTPSQENVIVLPSVDEVRKLIALKKFDEAQALLKKIEGIPELNMKENGIFWEMQAEASFNLTMNAYTSALELVISKNAREIVDKINENAVQKRIAESLDVISKAQNILNVDRKKFETQLDLENHPDKDAQKVKNDSVPLKVDTVAVKMLESKIYKITMMLNDLNVMQKTLKDAKTQTTSVYAYYKDIAEKEAKAETAKNMKFLGTLAVSGLTIGALFFIGNRKYQAHVAKKAKETNTKEMYSLIEKIEELFIKHRNNPNVNSTVIANFKERMNTSSSLSDIKEIHQQVNTYFSSI